MRVICVTKKPVLLKDFRLSDLSNGSFEVTIPSAHFSKDYDSFFYRVVSEGLELIFKGGNKEKLLVLKGIPIIHLSKLKKLKMIKVVELPSKNILVGLEALFVNERYYQVALS